MKQTVEVRATKEDSHHVTWCHEDVACQFSVYQGWPGDMTWVADFNAKADALDYGRYRAVARRCEFANLINQGI